MGLWQQLDLFISYASMFRCHMSCPTWLWHILCNSYVVDLYLSDDLWDVICYYVLDVWVHAYFYPVLYYLFWSNLYARAREGDGVY
jgi:hypothetical protein